MNKNAPLISVIVPIYNSENDLEKCIESIINQTYKNLEIILVNDGSTDNSLEICRKWENKDSRIILIDKKNGGLATSRNAGLDMASGDIIGFVDHDDFIDKDMYKTMIEDMQRTNADIVMCSHYTFDDNKITGQAYSGIQNIEIDGENLTKRMLNYEKIFCSSVWSKIYKRDLIGDQRFLQGLVLGEDYYFNGRLYPRVRKFYFDDKPLYHYRIRQGSMSRSKVDEHFFDKYRAAELLEEEYKQYEFLEDNSTDRFKFAILYEIVYRLYQYGANKEIKKEWLHKFKQQSKKCKKTFNKKDRIRAMLMSNFAPIFVKVTSK